MDQLRRDIAFVIRMVLERPGLSLIIVITVLRPQGERLSCGAPSAALAPHQKVWTMNPGARQNAFLLLLAVVFTIGLTFATVELPYLLDGFLQRSITTPGLDSHADQMSRLKTELFISHFHLRTIGYVCFGLLVLAVVAGFVTRRTGLAAVGAVGFMLPVFAQFASVMFFLAGLGALNILWLPVLDLGYDLSRLGLIIRAPYDLLMWPFRRAGISGYWPIVYFFLGSGLLLFFLGTFAWLSARAREREVADFWVYRISRHPQYLGWILWSYGVYLLLLRGLYPKRSWGIESSLPWLLSTLVIIGVAMLEELNMRRRFGDAYETYRRSAPFLFPLPKRIANLFNLPMRLLFRRSEPDRKREVAAVLSLYGLALIAASALFYGGGLTGTAVLLRGSNQAGEMQRLAAQLGAETDRRRRNAIGGRLAAFGDPAVDHFIPLLGHENDAVRSLAAERLKELASDRAVPALAAALVGDPAVDVRGRAAAALGAIGSVDCVAPLIAALEDTEGWVRLNAMRSLAQLGSDGFLERAEVTLREEAIWDRVSAVESLGVLRSERGLALVLAALDDEDARVRRSAVAAAAEIGAPAACHGLARAGRDEDWEVRVYAAEARKRLDCAAITDSTVR